jgi:hypothetical protein
MKTITKPQIMMLLILLLLALSTFFDKKSAGIPLLLTTEVNDWIKTHKLLVILLIVGGFLINFLFPFFF